MLEPRDGRVFTRHSLNAVADLTDRAWQLPYSSRVDSITNLQHSRAQGDELTVQDLVSQPRSLSDAELATIRASALAEPLLRDRLISPSADVSAVNIVFELPGKTPTQRCPRWCAPHAHCSPRCARATRTSPSTPPGWCS
jgi:hypothetical protein